MKAWSGLLCGALCAIAIACGAGAQKSAMPVAAAPERAPIAAGPQSLDPRAELDRLDRQIDDDLAKLDIAKPSLPPGACIEPPCATQMGVSAVPSSHDPTCKPGPAETCKDSCRLSDAICDNSSKICRIASDLGGSDRYANEKCETGKASCKAANERCCGCM